MQNNPRQIDMKAPRLFEDFRLANADPSRVREVGVVGTAYDSVYASEITYVSTPITSGAYLYAAMDAAGISDPEEFRQNKEAFSRDVIAPNLAAADAVAHRMVDLGGAVIAPAAFEARSLGWGQDDYMGLWLDVIERRATRLALVDGWQFSNGGAEEYLQALLMQAGRRDRNNMEIVNANGDMLTHADALALLSGAVAELISRGFRPVTLARVLHRCVLLHGMVRDEVDYGQLSDTCGKRSFVVGPDYSKATANSSEMRAILADIRNPLTSARSLLKPAELNTRSSLEIAPGLIRETERKDLSEQPAKILSSSIDDKKKPN